MIASWCVARKGSGSVMIPPPGSRATGGYCLFDCRVIAHCGERHRHPERCGNTFDRAVEQRDIWPSADLGVEDDGYPYNVRRDFFEQLQPFLEDRCIEGAKPGDISARPG